MKMKRNYVVKGEREGDGCRRERPGHFCALCLTTLLSYFLVHTPDSQGLVNWFPVPPGFTPGMTRTLLGKAALLSPV